jgi:uncharacterized protein
LIKMRKFLTAKWRDLVMANYKVNPSLLADFLPKSTTLDFHEGDCYVSLVAFKFLDTKVLGVPVPFHTNFEEVNLRFYVKRETKDEIRRGVVFVKEIVPKAAISFVAKTVYGEPYETWRMSNRKSDGELGYFWSKDKIENRLTVEYKENLGIPPAGSHREFIIEHYWGYTKRNVNRTDEYKVEHPKWEVFNVNYAEIEVDFGKTYGERFTFLSDLEPNTIFLAKGSQVSVYKGEKIG